MTVQHESDKNRFSVTLDAHQGLLEYRLIDNVLHLDHTLVPAEIGGRGVAGQLVRHALDLARSSKWKVAPHCSYVDTWMKRHPEYEDLRA